MLTALFNNVSACGATIDSVRRAQETEFSGRSNVSMNGTRTVFFCTRKTLRTFWLVFGEGYQPLVFVSLSSRNAGFACKTSGGSSGQMGGPPACSSFKIPDTESNES